MVAAGSVLLGTLYPLIIDALGMGKLSVGPPYFNSVFVPLMVPAMFPDGRWPDRALEKGESAGIGGAAALGVSGKRGHGADPSFCAWRVEAAGQLWD